MEAYCYPASWKNFTGEPPIDTGLAELMELIKAIRNRCDVCLDLYALGDREHLLHTILEDLYDDAQTIIDEYCIERNDD